MHITSSIWMFTLLYNILKLVLVFFVQKNNKSVNNYIIGRIEYLKHALQMPDAPQPQHVQYVKVMTKIFNNAISAHIILYRLEECISHRSHLCSSRVYVMGMVVWGERCVCLGPRVFCAHKLRSYIFVTSEQQNPFPYTILGCWPHSSSSSSSHTCTPRRTRDMPGSHQPQLGADYRIVAKRTCWVTTTRHPLYNGTI